MTAENLAAVISSLTPEEQESVKQFIDFLKRKEPSPFLAAVDEFIGQHPELLRRLAQ
jgi:hypothetical protein